METGRKKRDRGLLPQGIQSSDHTQSSLHNEQSESTQIGVAQLKISSNPGSPLIQMPETISTINLTPKFQLPPCKIRNIPEVPGLFLAKNFISEQHETFLLKYIESQPWCHDISRPTQHYGFKYSYKSKSAQVKAEPIPLEFQAFFPTFCSYGVFLEDPEQCIVNKYSPGQGITAHIDRVDSFGPVIASISLGSSIFFEFVHSLTKTTVPVFIPQRSLFFMAGDARFKWKHGIVKRKYDVHPKTQERLARKTRVSITFRNLLKR